MIKNHSLLKAQILLTTLHQIVASLALVFVPFFLKEQGYLLSWLILISFIMAGVGLILIPFVTIFYPRQFLMTGFLAFSLMALLFVYYFHVSFFIYSVLLGVGFILYWIPLNYLFFIKSSKNTNAVTSTWYMVSFGVIGIVVPPIGAWVINSFGYSWVFGIAAAVSLISIFFIRNLIPKAKVIVKFKESVHHFKGLKTIACLEGSIHFFEGTILAVYALLFFKTETEFGWFLSYLSLLAFIIAFVVAYRSDQLQKRKFPVFVLFLLMTFSIVMLPFAKTTTSWIIAVGAVTVLSAISFPLRVAVSMDVKKTDLGFWSVREFFLNLGRFITLGVSVIFFWYELYWPVFAMFGIITSIYPFLIHFKLKEIH